MFCYTAGTVVTGLAVYEFWFLAQILYWVEHNPATTRVMDARLEALRQNKPKATLDQKWADYERISIHLKRAIIIAEDASSSITRASIGKASSGRGQEPAPREMSPA